MLTADDSEFIRNLLREVFEGEFEIVGEAVGGDVCRSIRFEADGLIHSALQTGSNGFCDFVFRSLACKEYHC